MYRFISILSFILISHISFAESYIGAGMGSNSSGSWDSSASPEVWVGYRFGNKFALESSYIDLGQSESWTNETISGISLDAVYIQSVTDNISFSGSGGVYIYQQDYATGDYYASELEQGFSVAVSALYNFNTQFSVKLQARKLLIDTYNDGPVRIVLGINYSF
jgi:hypothetical protein